MNREQFNQFKEIVLRHLDDSYRDECYGTDRGICENLLEEVEEALFPELEEKESKPKETN